MDPDPGGPKACGSGSPTLAEHHSPEAGVEGGGATLRLLHRCHRDHLKIIEILILPPSSSQSQARLQAQIHERVGHGGRFLWLPVGRRPQEAAQPGRQLLQVKAQQADELGGGVLAA